MGTFGLERYDTKDFWNWLSISGFTDEHDFWSSLSGLSEGTTFDHMRKYLTDEGFTGTPHDQFRSFMESQVGGIGTLYDMTTVFYESAWAPDAGAGGDSIVDADGNIIVDADGNFIVDGGGN